MINCMQFRAVEVCPKRQHPAVAAAGAYSMRLPHIFTQEQILLKICKFKEEQEEWKMYTLWSTR